MAANTSPIFVKAAKLAEITFVDADSTTPKDLFVAGSDGSKLRAISAVSDDTSAVNMRLFIHDGGAAYWIGTFRIPTLSGTDGAVSAQNILSPAALPFLDQDGELFLPTGYKVQAGPLAAVTSTKTVTLVAFGADY